MLWTHDVCDWVGGGFVSLVWVQVEVSGHVVTTVTAVTVWTVRTVVTALTVATVMTVMIGCYHWPVTTVTAVVTHHCYQWCQVTSMTVLICWRLSHCVDVAMLWCVDDCADVLMFWCVACMHVDELMFWYVDVLVFWCFDCKRVSLFFTFTGESCAFQFLGNPVFVTFNLELSVLFGIYD
jgi:hypothetical protein